MAVAAPETTTPTTNAQAITEAKPRRIIFANGRFVSQANNAPAPQVITIEEDVQPMPEPVYYHRPPRRRAFIKGNYRYEPTLRDIRMLPVSTTLPQTMPGSIETLPVLPPMADGYFIIPRTR
jgi:hypothetical protein